MFHDLSCIHAFRLRCGSEIDYARVNAWIGVAIRHQVQELDVLAFTEGPISLPRILFTCKTLVVLKLGTDFQLVNFPVSIHLPSLKTLHLSIASPNNDLMQNLLCGCPAVEDFFFYGPVGGAEGSVFNISNPALKSLKTDLFYQKMENVTNKIVVNAPILECLSLQDYCLSRYLHANPVFLILKEISNVKFVSLGSLTMYVLHFADDNTWPVFPNLTHLELGVHNGYGGRRLLDLLNSAPSLAVLELKFLYTETFSVHWNEPQGMPICLSSHLKEVIINELKGLRAELMLVKYFLENALALSKMTINHHILAVEEERKFLKKILMFPRGSKICQIEVSGKFDC
ncbi:hypothetical protein F0562_022396 [Nyssa sinensis]|uniref:FBD domain-containing protein n=1 Tax=Nyssa sinensis TaxID=561372 RepID=A0A5J5BP31_9ASTE|nr:hypothetical protein F0562_022396 [Nyssa sinensis]